MCVFGFYFQGEYDYFTWHGSYLDAGFKWHPEWDVDYGRPLADAKVVSNGSVSTVYTRNYTNCDVAVVCPVVAGGGAGEGECTGSLHMKQQGLVDGKDVVGHRPASALGGSGPSKMTIYI